MFGSDRRSAAKLEAELEEEAARRLGLETDFMLRDAAEWQAMIDANPLAREAERDPQRVLAMVLKAEPSSAAVDALRVVIRGREVVMAGARHLYIHYPDGIGRSKLTGRLIEPKLGTAGTARNWNTVLALAAMAEERMVNQPG